VTITLKDHPRFLEYFAGVSYGFVHAQGTRLVGSAAGPRHCVHHLGAVRNDTNDPEFFPADTPGVVRRGGVFDDLPT